MRTNQHDPKTMIRYVAPIVADLGQLMETLMEHLEHYGTFTERLWPDVARL